MNATLTKAVLQLELDFPESERLDFRNRLETAQNQPLSGRDLQCLLESVDAAIN
jgi:hypothetical protein